MIPIWFLYLSGFSLVILGALQIQARPRGKEDSFYKRFINIGTFWSLACIVAGGAIILYALGYVGEPLKTQSVPKPARTRPGL